MSRKGGDFGLEYFDRAREIYIQNNFTLKDLANRSESLLGQKISYDALKDRAEVDNWEGLRQVRPNNGQASDVGEELELLRQILFQDIQMSAKDGLFLHGEFDEALVLEFLKEVDGVTVERYRPDGVDPQKINAYMNIIQKANINIAPRGTGKTTREQALDMIRDIMKEERAT